MTRLDSIKKSLPFDLQGLPTADLRSVTFLESLTIFVEVMEATQATRYSVNGWSDAEFAIELDGFPEQSQEDVVTALDTLVHDYAFDRADAQKAVVGDESLRDYVNFQLRQESLLNNIQLNDFCEYMQNVIGKGSGTIDDLYAEIEAISTKSISVIIKALGGR
jgi:hypothetical protein